ncbi:MAG: hypothetical protein LBU10_03240 [Endomicrobium sp.]|jgi:hypothetical protein|nr:hypothetical protein [Endomicrobium sp.]
MEQNKKALIYKNMFLVSTACGVIGVYLLYKQFSVLGWTFVCVWAVLAILVRVLIILDKKFTQKERRF